MKDPILYKIKQDIFYGLGDHAKCFSDLDIWEFSEFFDDKKDSFKIWEATKKGLRDSEEMLIYIHIPFCFSQCRFCNTFSFKFNKDQEELYIKYLIREAELFAGLNIFKDKKVSCLYFGGGTPTCVSIENLQKVFNRIRELFYVEKDCNITCEIHPVHALGNKGKKNIKKLKELGISRISMGVQTFDKKVLSYCNRFHTISDIREALENVKKLGLDNNIDMMTGLPGQTLNSLKRDFVRIEELQPDAIEYMRHEVVNDRVIKLYERQPNLWVDKDTLFEMNWLCYRWMEENGYEQNGCFSKNSRFFPYRYAWIMERPYLGLGIRAVSHFGEIRMVKFEDLSSYFYFIDNGIIPIRKFRILSKSERIYRTLLLRLQTRAGIEINEIKVRFGDNSYNMIYPTIEKLKEYGLIIDEKGVVRLTQPYGRYFVEDICNFITKELRRILKLSAG